MIHLDSSFLIRALIRGTDEEPLLRQWLRAGEPIGASVIAWAEFLCGPVSAQAVASVAALIGEPEPLDAATAGVAARLFNETGRRRNSLADCLIAASAIQAGAKLATSNVSDFRRLEAHGLGLI